MQLEFVGWLQILLGVLWRFWPVWLALAILFALSFTFKNRLGLYGQILDTGVGIAGLFICGFWLFTAIFAGTVAPFNPLGQYAIMKHARWNGRSGHHERETAHSICLFRRGVDTRCGSRRR